MASKLDVKNDIFTVEAIGEVVFLKMKGNPLYHLIDLQAKAKLFDCLDELNSRDAVRVLVVIGSAVKPECEEYVDLFCQHKRFDRRRKPLHAGGNIMHLVDFDTLARFCNAVNQFVLKVVSFNKFVIHADNGMIISPFMNLSLACDYRIVTQNSVYKNPYLDLGLVPKGGSAFFLTRLVGFRRAQRILLTDGVIASDEALKLGLVDQVVSAGELYESALKTARRYAAMPSGSLIGIKKLLNCASEGLKNCLQREDELFFHIVNSANFRHKLEAYVADCL